MTEIPHFALPFRFGVATGRHVLCNEQDSAAEITACVEAILRCPLGWRPELPTFGVPDPAFLREVDLAGLGGQIAEYEPRARISSEAERDALDHLMEHVRVTSEVVT